MQRKKASPGECWRHGWRPTCWTFVFVPTFSCGNFKYTLPPRRVFETQGSLKEVPKAARMPTSKMISNCSSTLYIHIYRTATTSANLIALVPSCHSQASPWFVVRSHPSCTSKFQHSTLHEFHSVYFGPSLPNSCAKKTNKFNIKFPVLLQIFQRPSRICDKSLPALQLCIAEMKPAAIPFHHADGGLRMVSCLPTDQVTLIPTSFLMN